MILFEYTFSPVLLAIVLIAVMAAGIFSARRHLSLSVSNLIMMLAYVGAVLLLAWSMLLPGRKESQTRLLKPRFAVVLDTSQSMGIRPRENTSNRWDRAQQALTLPWVQSVAAECEIQLFPLSDGLAEPLPVAAASTLSPDGTASRLRDGLEELTGRFSGLGVAGVLVLSDGRDTREAFNDWASASRPFPVYTVRLEPPGEWQEEVEARIDSVNTPRRVNAGWQSECRVMISGQGVPNAALGVQLFRNGQLLDEIPTQLPEGGGDREVVFNLEHPETGIFTYRAFIPPFPGEANTNDNEYTVTVQVTDARNRLIYIEGAPRWEYKFLRRVLMEQKETTPVIFYTGSDGTPQRGTPHKGITADLTPEQLAYFKIVILGNLDASELGPDRAASLVKFVNDGGSLVLLGGSRVLGEGGLGETALGEILPVRGRTGEALSGNDPFALSLTDAALAHPAFAGDADFWREVPSVLSVYTGPTPTPAAQALVDADTPQGTSPIVLTHRYGQGKVAVFLTDSLWKWQLDPGAGERKTYARFWTQMISWLLPDEDAGDDNSIQLFTDREQVHLGEQTRITARMADEAEPGAARVMATITFPDQRKVDYDMAAQWVTTASGQSFPGHQLDFTAKEPGLYSVTAKSGEGATLRESDPVSFFVKPYSPETVPKPINEEILAALARSGGGTYFDGLDELDRGLSDIRPQVIEEATAEFTSLWRNIPIMLAIALFLIASWAIRKTKGMP